MLCSVSIQTVIHDEGNSKHFNWRKADFAALCKHIGDVNWVDALCYDNVNDNWEVFKGEVQ